MNKYDVAMLRQHHMISYPMFSIMLPFQTIIFAWNWVSISR